MTDALAERARAALREEWTAGMRDQHGARPTVPEWTTRQGCVPDLDDELTVLALAAVARRRLAALEASGASVVGRCAALAAALGAWAGGWSLADIAAVVVEVLESAV